MMLELESLHVAKGKNTPWDCNETLISVEYGKIKFCDTVWVMYIVAKNGCIVYGDDFCLKL